MAEHKTSCARMVPEDDIVIRAMCGSYVYDPNNECTCGADTTPMPPKQQCPRCGDWCSRCFCDRCAKPVTKNSEVSNG